MSREKFDGVVEAVHYGPDGMVGWVRAYERRGPTFSDRVILKRQAIIEKLKGGKRFMVGQRVPYQASTFEVTVPVRVIQYNQKDVLVTGDNQADMDHLEGVPVV